MNVRMKLGLFSFKIEGNINQEIYKILESLGYTIDVIRKSYPVTGSYISEMTIRW